MGVRREGGSNSSMMSTFIGGDGEECYRSAGVIWQVVKLERRTSSSLCKDSKREPCCFGTHSRFLYPVLSHWYTLLPLSPIPANIWVTKSYSNNDRVHRSSYPRLHKYINYLNFSGT